MKLKFLYKFLIVAVVWGLSACDATDLDLQDDPNAVTPEQADIDFLYNGVVLDYVEFMEDLWFFSSTVSRMRAMTSGNLYANAYSPQDFNDIWYDAYALLFPDIDKLVELAEEREWGIHAGSGKLIKAYVMLTLVDVFGDVPFSEALQGETIVSPSVDEGSSVYAEAEKLIDEAIAQLGSTSGPTPANDLFYGGNAANWVTFGNTLKLKIYNTTRLVDGDARNKINALIDGGDLIDTEAEDFQFQYGTTRDNPNSRHPLYNDSYETTDGDYMSNYYMWLLFDEKEEMDPRIRFYFYRQDLDLSNEDPNVWECVFSNLPDPAQTPDHFLAVDPNMPYCIAAIEGYFGRDHGNNQGIPPDGPIRAVYGLYPVGGRFDDNSASFTQNAGTDGALGGGIQPILLSSYADFMRAEAALTLGTNDDARAMLESAVEKSLAKVIGFADKVDLTNVVGEDIEGNPITAEQAFVPSAEDQRAYVDLVLGMYDSANGEDEKLNVIMKEYFIALWGNGIEAYNNYRRTGKPDNVQPTLEIEPGDYIRSALYPADFVNLNSRVDQKGTSDQVFWDNNPPGFVY